MGQVVHVRANGAWSFSGLRLGVADHLDDQAPTRYRAALKAKQERVWDVFLAECSRRLELLKAARRVFCEDGSELFQAKQLANSMHLFISTGAAFIPKPTAHRPW